MDIALPGFIEGLHPEVEKLMFAYGRCTHRAYSMKWKATRKGLEPDRLAVIRQFTADERIPARYVVTAYDRVDTLPAHVTFGGKALQKLIMNGKITREKYRLRRNSILACRGEKAMNGNLCLRVEGDKLRVTIGEKRWIWLPLQIPEKYLKRYGVYLDGSKPYTVLLKRRLDMRGYYVRIVINVEEPTATEPKRLIALDINSGHVDFAVAQKATLKPVAFGKVNCHQLLDASKGRKQILTHRLVNKVRNIARHYDAEVVVGKLHAAYTNNGHRFNRRVQGMNQYALRQTMRYKLPNAGIGFQECSEAHTSVVGQKLKTPLGVDVHKASAYAFAIKTLDYPRFQSFLNGLTVLHEFCAYEGDGIPSAGRVGGSPLTVAHQSLTRLMCNELGLLPSEATPNQGKGGVGRFDLQSSILQVKV